MATIKSYTDIEQSRKLAEILSLESADMFYYEELDETYPKDAVDTKYPMVIREGQKQHLEEYGIPCWSLAALLKILHSRQDDITSLSGGGYKEGNYSSEWCLDYEYDNGDYQKTFACNPIDACYEMIIKLKENGLL